VEWTRLTCTIHDSIPNPDVRKNTHLFNRVTQLTLVGNISLLSKEHSVQQVGILHSQQLSTLSTSNFQPSIVLPANHGQTSDSLDTHNILSPTRHKRVKNISLDVAFSNMDIVSARLSREHSPTLSAWPRSLPPCASMSNYLSKLRINLITSLLRRVVYVSKG